MARGLTLLFAVILLLALAGYVLHERARGAAYVLWAVALGLVVLLGLLASGVL